MSTLYTKMLELKSRGFTYREIAISLKCSKSSVCYYLGSGQRDKCIQRNQKYRKSHPYFRKIESFLLSKPSNRIIKKHNQTIKSILNRKINNYQKDRKTGIMNKTITVQEVIDKFGPTPSCYLTGQPIDISKPKTYHFDHIVPVSRGGDNSLSNLGLCTKQANQCKSDLTLEELIDFCKLVLNHNKN